MFPQFLLIVLFALFACGCNTPPKSIDTQEIKVNRRKIPYSSTPPKSDVLGKEFRKIMYTTEYPDRALDDLLAPFTNPLAIENASEQLVPVFAAGLVPLLSVDPEIWGLILGIFFEGWFSWNYRVCALLTYSCKSSVVKCTRMATQVAQTIIGRVVFNLEEDSGKFGVVVDQIEKIRGDQKTGSDENQVLLWLNGEGTALAVTDKDVLVGLLRFIISEQLFENGFICRRILEIEKNNRGGYRHDNDNAWIGAGEWQPKGIPTRNVHERQKELLALESDDRVIKILEMTMQIFHSIPIPKNGFALHFEKKFKLILYTSENARDDLRQLLGQWGDDASRFILASSLLRSVEQDSFLWEFLYLKIFRQTARGSLTAKLSLGHLRTTGPIMDAEYMSNIIADWVFRAIDRDSKWWIEAKEEWDRHYSNADLDWMQISPQDKILLWINGHRSQETRSVKGSVVIAEIVRVILTSQISINGSVCRCLLGFNKNEEAIGEEILECQTNGQILLQDEHLLTKAVENITNQYISAPPW